VNSSDQSKLTIAFDTWTLASRFRNMGIYVYARKLLSHFREIATRHSVEVRPFVSSAVSNDASAFEASSGFRPQQTSLLKLDRAWRFGGACLSAFLSDADLLFCPSGNTLPLGPLVPVVTTIHDVTPIVLPAYPQRIARSLRFALANSAKLSRVIITDSICSKEDLMTVYDLPESKVHVVYLGCDEAIFNDAPPDLSLQAGLRKDLDLQRPYILHHGTIQPRKNLRRLIDAYRRVVSQNPNLEFDLVLVGSLGWQYEDILAAANAIAGAGRVILPGPQGDANLATLLKGASLVVIPSLYEGFCLPMVEAMACGAPVICSNTSCLPEVSGGVLNYFDPLSPEAIAACIEDTLENSEGLRNLSLRGKERASQFTWSRCAEETLAILKSAALN
jgi:glycosyltransferase involved in cell wall biosynthesis